MSGPKNIVLICIAISFSNLSILSQAWVVSPAVSSSLTIRHHGVWMPQRPRHDVTAGSITTSSTTFDGARLPFCSLLAAAGANNNDNSSNNSKSKKEETEKWWKMDLLESKIPDEYRDEIYKAEGNTKAAQERGPRIALYGFAALVGVACAFFNAFLTELRNPHDIIETAVSSSLTATPTMEELGFGWVQSNFLFQFLFLNKIGGGIMLIGGAASGLLAEAEYDSRRKNAEAIWEELQTRKQQKFQQNQKLQQKAAPVTKQRKKREGSKEAKRMAALAEVMDFEEQLLTTTITRDTASDEGKVTDVAPLTNNLSSSGMVEELDDNKDGITTKSNAPNNNILQSLQNFYEKADTMAASQALLLNKQLEDAGVIEKITDETGLKVIGREATTRLQQQQPHPLERDEPNKE